MKTKLAAAGFAAALALATISGALAAKPDDSGNENKQYVCHFTASEKNPVVIINVGNAAVPAHVDTPSHGHQGDDVDFDDMQAIEDCDEREG